MLVHILYLCFGKTDQRQILFYFIWNMKGSINNMKMIDYILKLHPTNERIIITKQMMRTSFTLYPFLKYQTA